MGRIFTAGTFCAQEILRSLDGVVAATRVSTDVSDSVRERFQHLDYIRQEEHAQSENFAALSVAKWVSTLSRWDQGRDSSAVAIARLTIAITALKHLAHTSKDGEVSGKDIFSLWPYICKTIKHPSLQERWFASRNAYGFVALPLYRRTINNAQNELIRLDVWLPDGNRGNPDFAIRSNQEFVQSWVLAGKGAECQYDVHSVTDESDATHAEYRLPRDGGNGICTQRGSTDPETLALANSEALVNCTQSSSQFLGSGATYSIPVGRFHSTQVQSESLFARLSYFDASRGFIADSPVLGPIHGDPFTHAQEPPAGTMTPQALADQVLQIQSWSHFVADGEHNAKIANWEHAKQSFDRALATLGAVHGVMNTKRYRAITLGKLGRTNRQFGRNAIAAEQLRSACADLEESVDKVKLSGELGTVYRQMSRLIEARASFEMQYDAAKALALLPRMCQAIGNIGMVNYQLWEETRAKQQIDRDASRAALEEPRQSTAAPIPMLLTPTTLDEHAETSENEDLLALAISQLRERLRICREIHQQHANKPGGGGGLPRQIAIWAAVGFSRLALCLIAQGNMPEAVHVTSASIEHARATGDPTVVAISHFFHGLALAADDQPRDAFAHFNAHEDGCTPAIAFSKEPSDEHRGYLERIIAAGADLTLIDGQGYTALDYAVFSSDEKSVALLVRGLRRQLLRGRGQEDKAEGDHVDAYLHGKLIEARRRKGYREVFQDIFRPILRGASDAGCIGRLRAALAHEFNASGENAKLFDSLRAVPYSVFAELGRLPRFTDGSTQELAVEGAKRDDPLWQQQTVLFISYRWLNSQNAEADDAEHTQYHRIRNACESFMRLHSHVTPSNLYLWIDVACIDQNDPERGVAALPIIVAQCNAVISLTDDQYYDRAWCTVEAMLIQQLCREYGFHLWYEQPETQQPQELSQSEDETGGNCLRAGPEDRLISARDKKLSFEADREKILFLERQTNLLM